MTALSITGISEIVLSVTDLPTMRAFYRDVLGFSLFKESAFDLEGNVIPDAPATITFLRIADTDSPIGRKSHPQVLVLIDHKRHPSGRRAVEPATSTLHHLAFEIQAEEFAPSLTLLRKMDLAPRRVDFPDINARSIFFKDPEENSVELICHFDANTPCAESAK